MLVAGRAIPVVNIPAAKGLILSVSGYLQALIKVGKAAKASLTIANKIAKSEFCVKYQMTKVTSDTIPQDKSKRVIFQKDCLFIKEATKTSKGVKPAMKIGICPRLNPEEENVAKKAIMGAKAQRNQVILLGITQPLSVALT